MHRADQFIADADYRGALIQYQLSAKSATARSDVRTAIVDLASIGDIYSAWGQTVRALNFHRQSLALATDRGDFHDVAIGLTDVGCDYGVLYQFTMAIDFENNAISVARTHNDLAGVEAADLDLCGIYDTISRYDIADRRCRAALAVAQEINDQSGEGLALSALGNIVTHFGQYQAALALERKGVALGEKFEQPLRREQKLCVLGILYRRLKQDDNAMDCLQKSLVAARKIGDIRGEDDDVSNVGIIYEKEGRLREALQWNSQAIALDQLIGDVRGEDEDFGNAGRIYEQMSNYAQSEREFESALLLERQLNDVSWEADTLDNLMVIKQKQGFPQLAIFYGKESVNAYQTIRSYVAKLGEGAQKTYLSSVESAYHTLADLLISRGRLPEAQQVLGLLKQQEFFQYIHPDLSEQSKNPGRLVQVTLTPREQKWDLLTVLACQRLTATSSVLSPELHEQFTSTPGTKYSDVVNERNGDAVQNYWRVTKSAAADLATCPSADDRLSNTFESSEVARKLTASTALVYTIVGDMSITEIVVTRDAIVARQSAAETSQQLDQDVTDYRNVLMDPNLDPRPLGKKFYNLIFTPIQDDLQKEGVKAILFSLDDALRYVPMAALVDPSGDYVVQNYNVQTVSLIGSVDTPAPVINTPNVLGLGSSMARRIGKDNFPALPGVPEELTDIVEQPNETIGVIPGLRLLDNDFTRSAMDRQLASRKYNLVHIASHFAIGATDMSSYLLLGDGTTESVANMRTDPHLFSGVDLLTLSACDTNEDLQIGNGHEIDSFGALMQQMGAKSVIASLWPVSDSVTPALMKSLYTYREQYPGASTDDDLRYAQLTLLTGSPTVAASLAHRGPLITRDSAALPTASTANFPAYTPDPKAPYAHPYFWAPFVLIGDWK